MTFMVVAATTLKLALREYQGRVLPRCCLGLSDLNFLAQELSGPKSLRDWDPDSGSGSGSSEQI